MKERLTSAILTLLFILFGLYLYYINNTQRALNVVTPTIIQIDSNKNNIIDENETYCIPDIQTFSANLTKYSEELSNKIGLSFEQSISIGYLADDFARSTLEGKEVKLELTGDETPECKYAQVFIEDKSYGELLRESGFAIKDNKPVSPDKFSKLKAAAEKLNLVIMNHHSSKYHTLDCKYGRAAHDAVVILLKEVPKDTRPCKFCHVDKHVKNPIHAVKISGNEEIPNVPPPPNIVTDGNLQLILTDFTRILKPDRNCSHAVCKEFVKSINSAQTSIDIAAYGWATIPAVNKALEDAQARGLKIRIVYDTNSHHENYYTETDDFLKKFDNTKSDEIAGNPKLTNMLMHNKFAIFDDKRVYTGSMNFSTTGFSGFNHNSVIIINSAPIAQIYKAEFDKMYEGNFHTLKTKSSNNTNIQTGNSTLSVYFSPQDKGHSTEVAKLIRESKRYIYIPTFLFTHKILKDELIKAHNRGVDVKIIIDATNTHGKHSVFKELRISGIPVKVENYAGKMHAKSIIIDDEYLVIGSANFSNSGENKNDENLLIINNRKLTEVYRDYFKYFWIRIPDKYLKYTIKAESRDSIGSCYDGVDNNFDGKIDNADGNCKK